MGSSIVKLLNKNKMKNRKEVVDAIISHMDVGESQEEVLTLYLDLARVNDEELIMKLVEVVNSIDSLERKVFKDRGHHWFSFLTSDEQKKFKANYENDNLFNLLPFDLYLNKKFNSMSGFLRSGFTFLTSNEGLAYWLELETDLKNK